MKQVVDWQASSKLQILLHRCLNGAWQKLFVFVFQLKILEKSPKKWPLLKHYKMDPDPLTWCKWIQFLLWSKSRPTSSSGSKRRWCEASECPPSRWPDEWIRAESTTDRPLPARSQVLAHRFASRQSSDSKSAATFPLDSAACRRAIVSCLPIEAQMLRCHRSEAQSPEFQPESNNFNKRLKS